MCIYTVSLDDNPNGKKYILMQYLYIGHRRLKVSKLDFLCTLITHLTRYHILSLLRTFFTIIILYFKHLLH